ncbi:MAG: MTH938/NDUFAF3 family protein [Candidatus Aenigmatarchaeota archaeon]
MVKIDSTSFGEITIDGKTYDSDMIVWWDGKVEYREKSHVFGLDEYARIATRRPECIIIGTGQMGIVRIEQQVFDMAREQGIEIYVETSPKAIKIFNAFVNSGKKTVAVIHVTC